MKVLVADDQPDVLMALRLLLKGEGIQSEAVSSPAELLRAASRDPFDLILMDLNYSRDTTSGAEGLDLLTNLKQLPAPPPAIVMTAWSSIDLAVEAMRRGAVDFVTKPWDNAGLVSTLRKNFRRAPAGAGPHKDDLTIARQVQSQLFPQSLPVLRTLDYKGLCVEAGAVGGDYYDFLTLGPGRLGLVLADVCGKGMAAALLMANLQATLRSLCQSAPSDWTALLAQVNTLFFQSTAPEHFATAFIGDYDDETRVLRFANCGHNPPLLLRGSGEMVRLEPTSTVLGAFRMIRPRSAEVRLYPGDWLILFSDGVVEAQSEYGDLYGEERLAETIRGVRQGTVEEMVKVIGESLNGFAHAVGRDDWTVVAARAV
ncbi:MAG: SpoIIE family protein phosphatase [Bryobacterales bacterium]|nr:SpoIIE family protein phosphatase [Bryobacterales bacterium]